MSTPLHYTNRYLSRALEELEGPAAAAGIGVYEDDRSGPASSGLDHGEARGGRRGSRTDRSSRGQRSRDEPTVWESYSRADRLRLGVGHLSDTRLSKGVNESVLKALKNERLACQFPVRTVAAATVLLVLRDRGIFVENEEWEGWLRNISGERVNMEDFGDVVEIMEDNR